MNGAFEPTGYWAHRTTVDDGTRPANLVLTCKVTFWMSAADRPANNASMSRAVKTTCAFLRWSKIFLDSNVGLAYLRRTGRAGSASGSVPCVS